MAAVLRSSFGKIIRHAFSMEGNFSVRHPQLRRRLLHTGDNVNCTPMTDASHAASSLKSPEVHHHSTKVNDVSKKGRKYAESLVEEQKQILDAEGSGWEPAPLFIAVICFTAMLVGYDKGHKDAEKAFGFEKAKNGK